MLGAESYFIKKMEKVAIQSSGLAFLFPRYSLKEMLGDESSFIKSGKGGEQSSGLAFLNFR